MVKTPSKDIKISQAKYNRIIMGTFVSKTEMKKKQESHQARIYEFQNRISDLEMRLYRFDEIFRDIPATTEEIMRYHSISFVDEYLERQYLNSVLKYLADYIKY